MDDCRIFETSRAVRRHLNSGLSPLPVAVVHRLNVDHLSTGLGDHYYVWRVTRPGEWGALLQWRADWWIGGSWYVHQSRDIWTRIANVAVTAVPGERFIRVGQVI